MGSGAGAAEDAGDKIASVVGKARGIATGGGAKTSAGDTIRSGGGAGADVDGEIKFADRNRELLRRRCVFGQCKLINSWADNESYELTFVSSANFLAVGVNDWSSTDSSRFGCVEMMTLSCASVCADSGSVKSRMMAPSVFIASILLLRSQFALALKYRQAKPIILAGQLSPSRTAIPVRTR